MIAQTYTHKTTPHLILSQNRVQLKEINHSLKRIKIHLKYKLNTITMTKLLLENSALRTLNMYVFWKTVEQICCRRVVNIFNRDQHSWKKTTSQPFIAFMLPKFCLPRPLQAVRNHSIADTGGASGSGALPSSQVGCNLNDRIPSLKKDDLLSNLNFAKHI